jgi:hypothetical protein
MVSMSNGFWCLFRYFSRFFLGGAGHLLVPLLLGPAPTGTGTIALDPTFGSFTLLEPFHIR